MIKNLNDLLSISVLLAISIYSLRLLIWSYIKKEEKTNETESKWQLILDYIDNEEE